MFIPVLRVDDQEIVRFFANLGERAPRFIAIALNRTRDWGVLEARKHAMEAFNVRSKAALNFALPMIPPAAFRATPAKLRAIVEPERIGQVYSPFEKGEQHVRDALGRPVAVPTSALRPTEMTTIPRQWYPVNLGLQPRLDPSGTKYYALGRNSIKRRLTPYRKTATGAVVKEGKLGTYEVQSKKNPSERLVFQRRLGPGNKGGVLIWVLKDSVPRPPILHVLQILQKNIDAHWPTEASAAIEEGIRTA